MKKEVLNFYAKRMMLASVLLLGVSEPLHAVSMSDMGRDIASQMKEKTQSIWNEAKEWKREQMIPKLETALKNVQEKVNAFIQCLKTKSCHPRAKAAAKAAVGIAAVALLVVARSSIKKQKAQRDKVPQDDELVYWRKYLDDLKVFVEKVDTLSYVDDEDKDRLHELLEGSIGEEAYATASSAETGVDDRARALKKLSAMRLNLNAHLGKMKEKYPEFKKMMERPDSE